MPTKNIASNWSKALRTLLQPKSILSGAVAGLRLILSKVSGMSSDVVDCTPPVGSGYGPIVVTVTADSVKRVSGVLAGADAINITAGVGEVSGYIVTGLPSGLLLLSKTIDMDDEFTRGKDFIELPGSSYLFYTDPSINSVITVDGDVKLSWVAIIGSTGKLGHNIRSKRFFGSHDHSINRKYSELCRMVETSVGGSTAGLYELAGCGRPISSEETIVKYWREGAQGFGLSSTGRVIKLSPAQLSSANVPGSSIESRITSDIYLYTLDGRTRSIDITNTPHPNDDVNKVIPAASNMSTSELRASLVESFGNTFDITNNSLSVEGLRLLDSITPKVLRQNIIQHIRIASADQLYSSALRIYFGSGPDNKSYIEIPVCEAVTNHNALRWISDNGFIVGRAPVIGDRLIRCEVISDSTSNGECVILKCIQLPGLYLYPSSSLVITINN